MADPERPLPVFYSFRRCPYAMRARLALSASGLPYELREVILRDKPAEMLAASPKATVPVLVLTGGEVMDESLEIMLWALQQNDPGHWLKPQRGLMADMLDLIAANDGSFKQHLDRYKYPNRYPHEAAGGTAEFAHAHRAGGALWLCQLEAMLTASTGTPHASGTSGWLFGPTASLADLAILPFVRQFAHTDAAWFALQPWPQLLQWLAHFEASALYEGVMGKYPAWRQTP